MTDLEIAAGYALRQNLEVSLLQVVKAMKKHSVTSCVLMIDGVAFSVAAPCPDGGSTAVAFRGNHEEITVLTREPGDGE
jgi:hypothetical protein